MTSKKRRQARAWMQREVKERELIAKRAKDEGIYVGREQMKRDARTLYPPRQRVYNNEDGGIHASRVIESFPSPYDGIANFRVPFPQVSPLSRDWAYAVHLSEREQYLDFRPVEHAFRKRVGNSSVELRWFAWEPSHGSKELEEHTKGLFHGMNKLAMVQRMIEGIAHVWGPARGSCRNCGEVYPEHPHYVELQRSRELLGECVDELRLRLGNLAPKENISPREEEMRYLYRVDPSGRPL